MIRDKAYQILSDLIYKGFLTTGVRLGDSFFIFKTVNNKEYQLIKMCAGNSTENNYTLKFNIYFLIYSLFMVNGKNVLDERNDKIEEYYKFFINIPEGLYKKIFKEINTLRVAVFEATEFLEGFSYTNDSRHMWKICGGFPCKEEFTGVSGTLAMGLNVHQENWMNINKVLDYEDDYNDKFNLAAMIASASNPKGAKQIRARHDTQVKSLQEKREKLAKVGYLKQGGWKPEGWAVPVNTTEDIVAELERQMHGIKDKHDIFMEKYLNSMREKAENKAQEARAKMEAIYKASDGVMFSGEHRVLTSEEMAALKKRKMPTVIRVASEEAASPEDKERFLKKTGSRVMTGR